MAGNTNFPTALDDNSSLFDVTDNVTALVAAHHNNIKEAVKNLEAKVGIYSTSAPTSLDYRLGSATNSHNHDGASGNGRPIPATSLDWSTDPRTFIAQMSRSPSLAVGSNITAPVILGKTMQLLSVQGALRRGPSGATTALDVLVGPTSIFEASQGFRPIFPAGATAYRSSATPNLITYPSGAVITLDVDAVGSNEPGQDLSITFIFRE